MTLFYDHISDKLRETITESLQDLAFHIAEDLELDVDKVKKSIESFTKSKGKTVPKNRILSVKKESVKVEPKRRSVSKTKNKNSDEEEESTPKKRLVNKKPVIPRSNTIKVSGKGVDLLRKRTKRTQLNATKIGNHIVEQETRICLDLDAHEGYGVLDKDNETVKPLKDEHIRFLDAHNYNIRETKKTKAPVIKKKIIPKKREKEESEEEDELSDIDVNDETNEEVLEELEDEEEVEE